MKNQTPKGISSYLLILIVIVSGLLAIGAVLGYQYFWPFEEPGPTPVPKLTPPSDETANWKVYRNEEYGFEVKYPGGVNFESIDYTDPDDLRKHNINPGYSAGNLLLIAKFSFANESRLALCASYEIEVRKTDYLDINNWVEDRRQRIETPSDYEGTMISGKLSSVEDIEIQNKVAKRITIEGGFPFWTAQFGVINNGKLYIISYLDMSSYERPGCFERSVEQGKIKYRDIFDKLLSTFRFIKIEKPPELPKDETADWRTYKNEELGYEIKYPEKLEAKYIGIHFPHWPPKVNIKSIDPDFVCEEIQPSPAGRQKEVVINGITYCVSSLSSPTAGSIYVEFKYLTNKNDKQLTLEFTLLYPDCGLYDDNKMEECKKGQGEFNVNALADKILSTFRFID